MPGHLKVEQSNILFYCELDLVGVVMNMIHICIVLHRNIQDAYINFADDWNTFLGFLVHQLLLKL
jgi:hypothetical protein